ncbi:outer membrane beta-barrel protein [Flavobacterium sp. SUN052]|uniref:outer membrane beta-barrel protein n=1 Tax=Flavobacterium sp. SUN052 TaxID=3002441 RepID=UPI00237EC86A|nr:outer membrane beta-barrel protein [Flavobacterium sp. SUN052]MEC4005557.1 outer membrane beta-barrel protein [Flavobacterium sp. SUN052]
MKNVILTVAAIFAFGFANAQEKKESKEFGFSEGNVLVEGNLGFNSTNDKNTKEKTNSFEFNPKVGYFLSDKFAVGVQLGFGSDKAETNGADTDKNSNLNVGVFGRYYFLDLGQRFKTYAELGVNSNSGKTGLAEAKYTGLGVNAGLGINYFVSKSFAINFGLTDVLSYASNKYKGGETVSAFTGNVNVFNNFFDTAKFGLTYKF